MLLKLEASLIVASFAIVLAGCSVKSQVEQATEDGILLFGNSSEPKGLDPHQVSGVLESNIIRGLFEGLCVEHQKEDGVATEGVAKTWTPNDDFTEWTFDLRDDAKWSDGEPVTAEDFLFAFQRILTPELASDYSFMLYYIEGAEAFHKGETSDFSTVKATAPDPHTLKVKLRGPLPFLPELTKHYTWFPVPKHTVLKHGAIDDPFNPWASEENIVSNGAFKLKTWRFNDHIEVERNPYYWDKANVGLNGIRYLPVKNLYTEARMFFNHQLHITYTLPPELIEVAKKEYPDNYRNELYLGTRFMRVNIDRPGVNDVKVRQALSIALDTQTLIDSVLQGGQKPAYSIVPPNGSYRTPKMVEYSPEKAKQLLAEAGYPEGEGFPELNLLTTDQETAKRMAEAYQAMWKEVLGITVGIRQMEWTSYLTTMFAEDYDSAASGWIGDYLDPTTFLDMWVKDGGNNNTNWSSEEYEALLHKAENTADRDERYRVLEQAEQLMMSERPILPVYWYTRNYLVNDDVEGWYPLLLDNHPFKSVRLKKHSTK